MITALTFFLLLKPWMSALDGELQRLSVERHRLASELGIIGSGGAVEQRLSNSSSVAQLRLKRLFASDRSAAAADFHAYVAREAVRSRLFLESAAGSGQAAGSGALGTVGLEIVGLSDFAGSLEMLRRLETSPHLVLVESFRLESRSPESSPMAYLPTPDLPLLSLEVRLSSFLLQDSVGDSAPSLARDFAP